METISWNDFEKIDIRVGTIITADEFTKAKKPSYKLTIDFGIETGIKNSSAQITKHYSLHQLPGKQVIAVTNFAPKQIANFLSECLVLGIYDKNNEIVLLRPDNEVANGLKIG